MCALYSVLNRESSCLADLERSAGPPEGGHIFRPRSSFWLNYVRAGHYDNKVARDKKAHDHPHPSFSCNDAVSSVHDKLVCLSQLDE